MWKVKLSEGDQPPFDRDESSRRKQENEESPIWSPAPRCNTSAQMSPVTDMCNEICILHSGADMWWHMNQMIHAFPGIPNQMTMEFYQMVGRAL